MANNNNISINDGNKRNILTQLTLGQIAVDTNKEFPTATELLSMENMIHIMYKYESIYTEARTLLIDAVIDIIVLYLRNMKTQSFHIDSNQSIKESCPVCDQLYDNNQSYHHHTEIQRGHITDEYCKNCYVLSARCSLTFMMIPSLGVDDISRCNLCGSLRYMFKNECVDSFRWVLYADRGMLCPFCCSMMLPMT